MWSFYIPVRVGVIHHHLLNRCISVYLGITLDVQNMGTSTDSSKPGFDMSCISQVQTNGLCIKYWNSRYATSRYISNLGLGGSMLVTRLFVWILELWFVDYYTVSLKKYNTFVNSL